MHRSGHVWCPPAWLLWATAFGGAKIPHHFLDPKEETRVTKFRSVALAFAAGATALSLTACANNSATPAPASTAAAGGAEIALITPGNLTVCTHLSYKPFQFTEGGTIVGFDVDVMDLVAKKLGVTQQVIDIEFDQITSGAVFTAKKCDVGRRSDHHHPRAGKAAPFSEPYFASKQALLVKADSSVISLAEDEGTRSWQCRPTPRGKTYAEEHAGEFGYSTKVFDDMPTGSNAVLAGTVRRFAERQRRPAGLRTREPDHQGR
jgi:polar amino acid transport system substrate-binding protein